MKWSDLEFNEMYEKNEFETAKTAANNFNVIFCFHILRKCNVKVRIFLNYTFDFILLHHIRLNWIEETEVFSIEKLCFWLCEIASNSYNSMWACHAELCRAVPFCQLYSFSIFQQHEWLCEQREYQKKTVIWKKCMKLKQKPYFIKVQLDFQKLLKRIFRQLGRGWLAHTIIILHFRHSIMLDVWQYILISEKECFISTSFWNFPNSPSISDQLNAFHVTT